MGDMGEVFEVYKINHKDRVQKTPARIEYAIKQFKDNNIKYELKNEETGHFLCLRKSDGKLFQFYAGTGKIKGYNRIRGIKALIKLLNKGLEERL